MPFANLGDRGSIKKRFWKKASHKIFREQKNLHVDPDKKIQFNRSRSDGITWFLLYKSV